MRKSLVTLLTLACLSFVSVTASAHDYDGMKAQLSATAYQVDNVMQNAIPDGEGIKLADLNVTAKYALNDSFVTFPDVIVTRDFRTIADSGGHLA